MVGTGILKVFLTVVKMKTLHKYNHVLRLENFGSSLGPVGRSERQKVVIFEQFVSKPTDIPPLIAFGHNTTAGDGDIRTFGLRK